jgi:amino acid adenylation domain-containing protein
VVERTEVVDLQRHWPTIAQYPTSAPDCGVTPDHLAYVIYTSGSTGDPKGVEIQHAGVSNLIAWHQLTYQVTPHDRATLIASPAFDASGWELWPYLSSGASLHVPDEATRLAPDSLLNWLQRHRITLCFLPTPLAEALLEQSMPSQLALRVLLTGGDALHPVPHPLPFTLVNHYGPTEYSVVTTWAPVISGAAGAPAIGRPIANTELYVLDAARQPVPIGVPGELYIGGVGIARGYLNRPELTAERFITPPPGLSRSSRLYRTGDLVRYLPDGQLEFLGRLDIQVKLRGFRIELGEIEAVVRRHDSVRDSVVVVHEATPGDKRLVAYVVWHSEGVGSAGGDELEADGHRIRGLREFLREQVPEYMTPSTFMSLDALPLTANGKVDRRALPIPEALFDTLQTDFVAPQTPVEQALAAIWTDIMGLEQVGIHDDFFALGGHSILATRAIAQVRERFKVELPLHTLFEEPTIAHIATVIEQAQTQQHSQSMPRIRVRPRGEKTIEQLVPELNNLSDSEAKAMLLELQRRKR